MNLSLSLSLSWVRISSHFFPSQTPLEWELVVISSLLKTPLEWVSVWKPCPFEPPTPPPFVFFLLCVWRRKCTEVFLFWAFFWSFRFLIAPFKFAPFIISLGSPLCSALLWSALVGTTSVLSCYPINFSLQKLVSNNIPFMCVPIFSLTKF